MSAEESDYQLLSALVDGDLIESEKSDLARRLSTEPALASELSRLRADVAIRRAVFAALEPGESVAVEFARKAVIVARREERWAILNKWTRRYSAAAACVLIGFTTGWIGRGGGWASNLSHPSGGDSAAIPVAIPVATASSGGGWLGNGSLASAPFGGAFGGGPAGGGSPAGVASFTGGNDFISPTVPTLNVQPPADAGFDDLSGPAGSSNVSGQVAANGADSNGGPSNGGNSNGADANAAQSPHGVYRVELMDAFGRPAGVQTFDTMQEAQQFAKDLGQLRRQTQESAPLPQPTQQRQPLIVPVSDEY